MRARDHALLLIIVLVIFACALAEQDQDLGGPESLILTFDHPRPEKVGVGERWIVARENNQAFLVHAWDVERRRTLQTCGSVPPKVFVAGWEELDAAGLLVGGEDLRLTPPPGHEPFAGRLQLGFRDKGRRVSARRPLSAQDARVLLHVLRRWEETLRFAEPASLPGELRAEIAIGGCGPPRAKRREPARVPR